MSSLISVTVVRSILNVVIFQHHGQKHKNVFGLSRRTSTLKLSISNQKFKKQQLLASPRTSIHHCS